MVDSVQSSYEDGIGKAYAGLPYDLTDLNAYGRSAEASALRFGCAVVQGTNDNQVRLPDTTDLLGGGATTGAFRGVVVREHVVEGGNAALAAPVGDGDSAYFAEGETVSVATHGRIWVVTEQAVSPGDSVFYRHVAAGAQLLGAFRKDADTANATQVSGARFVTSAGAGELAVIELSTSV